MSEPQVVDRWKDVHTLQKAEGEKRLLRGLVTTGSVDSDGEIVDQDSAFEKLVQWQRGGGNPITFMHDIGGSLGRCVEVERMTRTGSKDALGAFRPASGQDPTDAVQVATLIGTDWGFGTMLHGRVEVNDVWAQLEFGALNKHSIGFRGFEAGEDDVTGAPRVMVQRVFEYAVVTVPAQREAEAVVERMLKSLGVQRENCTHCRDQLHRGLGRTKGMEREQWAYVIAHAREHAQDHPRAWDGIAKAFTDLAGKGSSYASG